MIELELLGPPRLLVDGAEPRPEMLWRKHLALLIYLARSPRVRTRDHLVGLLWPEREESKARHSLNEALRVIRRAAGDALLTEGETVRLAPNTIRLDIDNLEDLSEVGVFLEGFTVPDAPAFEDWMTSEREGLRANMLDNLVVSAEQCLADGKLSSARDLANKALDIEPHHEPAVQALMRAHALAGSRALALKVFGRFSDAIERDLQIEPGRMTKELAERIQHERLVPGARTTATTFGDVVPVVGPGRKALAACLQLWGRARSGSPSMVVLRGEPGTGKTRIADEIAARARLDGAVVAFARALDHEKAEGIWSALLKGGLVVPELSGAAPQVLAALGSIEPDLFARFPSAKAYEPTSMAAEPFLQAVSALAEARPVLLIIDDVHKADQEVLGVLSSVVQRAGDAPIAVVLSVPSVPSVPVDTLCQRIGRDIPGSIVETNGFELADVEELVVWAFPGYDEDATNRLTRRVLADTAGNPFLAVELIRAVKSGLRLREDAPSSAWPDAARTLDQTMPGDLPATVAASLRVRFQTLSSSGQVMLTVVAVVGGNETIEVLARAGDVSVADAERALDELEWQRWIVSDARGFCFVTGLAREVVLADMVTGGNKKRILKRAGLG